MTRLETRTKESIHMCKCAGMKPGREMKVTIVIEAAMTGYDLRREV